MARTRPLTEADRAWAAGLLAAHWGSPRIVTRGRLHDVLELDGVVAEEDGRRVGLLSWELRDDAFEIVSLNVVRPRRGVGRALVSDALRIARGRGARRTWLVTTNDNVPAMRFWEAVGFRRVAVHRGAVMAARRLKPEIPDRGLGGVPIQDEIEFSAPTSPTGAS